MQARTYTVQCGIQHACCVLTARVSLCAVISHDTSLCTETIIIISWYIELRTTTHTRIALLCKVSLTTTRFISVLATVYAL